MARRCRRSRREHCFMSDCKPVSIDGKLQCPNCGVIFPRAGLRKTCSGATTQVAVQRTNATPKAGCGKSKPPSLLQKAANFGVAAIGHALRGNPTCTQEQIDARLAICQGCDLFKDNACLKCGCAVVREQQYLNKLAWADQQCPHPDGPKWGPISPVSSDS